MRPVRNGEGSNITGAELNASLFIGIGYDRIRGKNGRLRQCVIGCFQMDGTFTSWMLAALCIK